MGEELHKHRLFFDAWSKFYDFTPGLGFLLRKAQSKALRRLAPKSGERILDLGCGPGRGSKLLLEQGCHVVAGDYSMDMLEKALVTTWGRARATRLDAGCMPFKTASFDGMLCTNSFHHYPDVTGALKEMRRVLKPGGRLSLVDPAAESIGGRIAIDFGERIVFGLKEVHLHSLEEWAQLLKDAGFSEVLAERGPWYSPTLRTEAFLLAYA